MNEMFAMNTMHDANGAKLRQLNRVVSRVATTALVCAIGEASAQCQYTVQSWPGSPCSSIPNVHTGTGLNNFGGWCGYRLMCYSTEGEGWLGVYCPPGGSPAKLPLPPNAGPKGAQATAVNDAGVVVGYSYQGLNGSHQIGCIWWPDGTVQEIPDSAGTGMSRANGVNNLSQITGQMGSHPYFWSAGVVTEISIAPLPGGFGAAISDSGWIAGSGGNVTGTNGRGFRWKDGVLEILPPLNGNQTSDAKGINNAGEVCGISRRYVQGVGYLSDPSVWRHGSAEVLPLPPGYTNGWAMDINDAGVIVGRAYGVSGSGLPSKHVVWCGGEVFELSSLVVSGSTAISLPKAINASGQILSESSAKVLTPASGSPADLTGDCAVDGSDLMKLLSEWGPREWSVGDLNHDGIVNGADLAQVLGNWTGSK